jgi:conjugal transfer pilus assembly protein TraV
MSARPIALLILAVSLGGCANFSGLGGDSKYACKAPEGVACDSVSGTYANALQNNLPSQRQHAQRQAGADFPNASSAAVPRVPLVPAATTSTSDAAAQPPATGSLRSQARILRLWTKPWEDADGDLYDQGYVYVQVSAGQWLIDHVQQRIRDAFAPLRPPAGGPGGSRDAPPNGDTGAEPAPARPASSSSFPSPPTPAQGQAAGSRGSRNP